MSFTTPSKGIIVVTNEEYDDPENHMYVVNVDAGPARALHLFG